MKRSCKTLHFFPFLHGWMIIVDEFYLFEYFIINIKLYAMDYCGTRSGRNVNKWDILGLAKEPSSSVQVPRIREFPFNIECKVIKKHSFGSHTSFFGEIVAIHADETLVEDGKLKHGEINQLAYIAGKYFQFPKEPVNVQNFSIH